ncbi:MAG: Na/Pi cotransporter family protein [Phycisphaeraceae bacterium]
MSWFTLITGLLGGLALFLYGLDQLTRRLSTVAGEGMRTILAKLTANRFSAMAAGATVTAIIQSSSVTTVLLVGFVSAGLISMQQSIGVIIGANIGSTVTAQLIAFRITEYAMALIAAGFFAQMISRASQFRDIGLFLMGLGLLFLGMESMTQATNPLRSYEPFLLVMKQLETPLFAALAGMIFTAIVQSSAATTGLVIVFAGQGILTLPAGIAIILGANVGTCVTAVLATIGKPRQATQVALFHVIFNVTGVIVALLLLRPFVSLVQWFTPVEGGATSPRQIANAHTLFNIANAVLFIGFTGPLSRLVQWLAPLKPAPRRIEPMYLERALLDVPAAALDAARRETGRLGEQVIAMVRLFPLLITARSVHELDPLGPMDEDADTLHSAIVAYLGQVATRDIDARHARRIQDYLELANDLENIGDTVEKEVAGQVREQLSRRLPTLEPTEAMTELIRHATWMIETAVEGVTTLNEELTGQVIAAKARAQELVRGARNELSRKLHTGDHRTVQSVRYAFDYVGHLNYLTYLARRVAKVAARKEKDEKRAAEGPGEGEKG